MVKILFKIRIVLLFSFIFILVLLPLFSFQKEKSIDKNPSRQGFLPALASRELSSYNPTAIRSSLGSIHLLFFHKVQVYDYFRRDIYHTFEVENGTWSVPQKVVKDVHTIFNIITTERGFAVYYYNEGGEGIDKRGPCKKEYDEHANRWSTETHFFGKSQIVDYLNLSVEESRKKPSIFAFWIHSFRLEEDGTYFVVWSFEFDFHSNLTHEYEHYYLVSRVSTNGSMDTQPILELTGEHRSWSLTIISSDNSLFLYSHVFDERAMLHPNGSWSEWETTGFLERYTYWNSFLVLDRYLLWHGVNKSDPQLSEIWGLIDLAAETLSIRNFNLPHWPNFEYRVDVEGVLDTQEEIVFKLGLISNQSIELWSYDFQTDKWTQIAAYKYNFNFRIDYFSEIFYLDLLCVADEWHLFWDQKLIESKYLHEIFTVSYNEETKNWGSFTQVTDTRVIRDDYISSGWLFSIVLFVITVCLWLRFHQRRKKLQSRI